MWFGGLACALRGKCWGSDCRTVAGISSPPDHHQSPPACREGAGPVRLASPPSVSSCALGTAAPPCICVPAHGSPDLDQPVGFMRVSRLQQAACLYWEAPSCAGAGPLQPHIDHGTPAGWRCPATDTQPRLGRAPGPSWPVFHPFSCGGHAFCSPNSSFIHSRNGAHVFSEYLLCTRFFAECV